MCKLNKQDKNIGSNNFEQEQYAVISNEFITCSTTAQNVITINLVISFGVIAALVSILTNNNLPLEFPYDIICKVLCTVGLWGATSCIRTINFQEKNIMYLKKLMCEIEKRNLPNDSKFIYHTSERYKPLHITRLGFCMFYEIFFVTFVWILVNDNSLLPGMNVLLKCIIYSAIIIMANIFLIMLSNHIFKTTNKAGTPFNGNKVKYLKAFFKPSYKKRKNK